MQVLTSQLKALHPGAVIYGIGDEAHKRQVSGHNEDDTAGVRAEDQDPDSTPEHRAIDIMIGPAFTAGDADLLVASLVAHEANRKRMLYINWRNVQWSRSNGWAPRDNSDDPHHDHVHISGEADADENVSAWILTGSSNMADLDYGNVWPKPTVAGDRPAMLMIAEMWAELHLGQGAYGGDGFVLRQLARIEAALKALAVEVPPIDYDKLAEALMRAGVATAAGVRDAVADGLEGGSGAVRADS